MLGGFTTKLSLSGGQIMPQMLYYLKVDKNTENVAVSMNVDWGTIDVYTCTNSCDAIPDTAESTDASKSRYYQEFVYIQKPVNFKAHRWSSEHAGQLVKV